MNTRVLWFTCPLLCLALFQQTQCAEWPISDDLRKARGETCVAGSMVGPLHKYMHVGDTKSLNGYLAKIAKSHTDESGQRIEVIIHSGTKSVYTWTERVAIGDEKLTIDVWLGSGIDLRKLKVPKNLEIFDGGEVRDYILRHRRETLTSKPNATSRLNSGPGFTDDPKEIEQIERHVAQMRLSTEEITIREAALFHMRFINQCMPLLPDRVEVQYSGKLRTDNGRGKMRVHGQDLNGTLDWLVYDELGIFDMSLTSMPTAETVVGCNIEGHQLFVNVLFVDGGRSLDDKLPELGGHSVREILKALSQDPVRQDAQESRAESLLDAEVSLVEQSGTLKEAIEQLQKDTGTSIVLDEKIDVDRSVNQSSVADLVSLRTALRLVLHAAGYQECGITSSRGKVRVGLLKTSHTTSGS